MRNRSCPLQPPALDAGPGRRMKDGSRAEMPIANGDEVIYGPYAGSKVELNGVEYKILRADEILAKLG